MFQRDRTPWVDPAQGSSDDIAAVDSSVLPATAELGGPLTLTVPPNGSVLAEGNFLIESGDGDHAVLCSGKLSFCRCGHSANKPFCDGTHKKVGFEAE